MELTWPEGGGQMGLVSRALNKAGLVRASGERWRASLATGLHLVVSWVGPGVLLATHYFAQ